MKSTLKPRPAAQIHTAAARGGVHREPSNGAQTKSIPQGGGFSADIDSAPRVALQRKQLHAAFGNAIQRQAGPEEKEQNGSDPFNVGMPVQRQGPEEEELLQGKFDAVQRQGPEDDELLQGKFETTQRQGPEEEELLQGRFETAQRPEPAPGREPRENNTGMPDNLKAGIEHLSGASMDHVKVHYNSSQSAQLNAIAYAQGSDIHVAPGQEQHLPHEAWHVVQQAQGRVRPTMQMKDGVPVNDDQGLEHEADVMGAKALQTKEIKGSDPFNAFMDNVKVHYNSSQPAQLNALAYAQGSDIHVAPGQEKQLPHEAWHVVQQAQGRVRPTMQMTDRMPVNDEERLEREADLMGAKAVQVKEKKGSDPFNAFNGPPMQRVEDKQGPQMIPKPAAQRETIDENDEMLQGKFQPAQLAGVAVNDDEGLEREADLMGGRAQVMPQKVKDGPEPRTAAGFSAPSSSGPVAQRMVSMTDWHRVYAAPQTVAVDDRFGESLNTLMGDDHTIQQLTWAALKAVIWGVPGEGAPLQDVHNKFQHPRKVHVYANKYAARVDAETEVKNLLLPADMSEAADQLSQGVDPATACVIQALVGFGVAAPAGAATVHSWHNWARGQNLDYRTDSDIIRIYVGELGYSLVNNKTVTLDAVDWDGLGGNGNYLVSSYVGMPAGVGHMIGLVINGGVIQTIHDRQNLTAPTLGQNPAGVSTRYIYKM